MAEPRKAHPATRHVQTAVKDELRVRDRRQQLIDAAVRVFLEKGFHATTVRDIGTAAGLTQGTIYNYVRSKDDILYLACDHVVGAYQDAVRQSLSGLNAGERPLEAILHAIIDTMEEYQDYILLIYHETHALDRNSLHALLARVEKFVVFIEEILADAGVRVTGGQLAVIANIITFLPTMVSLRRWLLRRVATREEVREELTRFMMKGLSAD